VTCCRPLAASTCAVHEAPGSHVGDAIVERLTPSQPDHHGTELVADDRFEWRNGARRFEYWEHSVAGWLGLGAAVVHALGWGIGSRRRSPSAPSNSERRHLPALLRLSVHYTTTMDELTTAVALLAGAIRGR